MGNRNIKLEKEIRKEENIAALVVGVIIFYYLLVYSLLSIETKKLKLQKKIPHRV
jgi:hypothetical protein